MVRLGLGLGLDLLFSWFSGYPQVFVLIYIVTAWDAAY